MQYITKLAMVDWFSGSDVDDPYRGRGAPHQGQQVSPLRLQRGGQSGIRLLQGGQS
jgi:hypothetical protein